MDQLQPLECVLFSFLCLPRIPGEQLSLPYSGSGGGGGGGGNNSGEPLVGNPGRQPEEDQVRSEEKESKSESKSER